MKTIKKIIYFITVTGVLTTASCSDYLDVSRELSLNLTMDEVFDNPTYVYQWYNNIYNCIVDYSNMGSGTNTSNGMSGPWSAMAGEIMQNNGGVKDLYEAGYTAASAQYHRWATEYQYIRQAMIFLERAKPIGNAGDVKYLSEHDLNRMKAEAKYLLAYSYFCLFELYGPVPVVRELADPENPNIDYPRSSVDELVKYMDDLLIEAINTPELPASTYNPGNDPNSAPTFNYQQTTRPTKVTAMALRAKIAVYAASTLFNGGFEEALKITNPDGSRLFPDADPRKWETAKLRLEELITFAEAQGHKLYRSATNDPHLNVYELYQDFNDEILWSTTVNQYSSVSEAEKRTTPRDMYSCYGNIGVSQEVVDAFFMSDGLSKDDSQLYDETGFSDVVNPASATKRKDTRIFNMYANREPRFYAAVTYQGRSWHIQPDGKPNYTVGFAKGQDVDNRNTDSPRGGYLFYKFKNRKIAYFGSNPTSYNRPAILFRLADFYLYYAEACNEVNASDPNVIAYIDSVRSRAGIPLYRELHDSGTKTSIVGRYEAQKEAIIQERLVELLGEGQRYFDMCRWMICEPNKSKFGDIKQFHGMNMNGSLTASLTDPDTYFKRVQIESRSAWTKKYYFYPVPQNELNKSRLLVQNPLWETVRDTSTGTDIESANPQ